MKPVICFGEALIDFLNTGNNEQEKLTIPQYSQFPGGAPANAAVAVAKLGGNACFAGQVGQDHFGDFLIKSMNQYGVDTGFTLQHPTAPTALAFVSLDENNERSFSFYREGTADVILSPEQVNAAWFSTPSILHFCSNTLTTPAIADCTHQVIQKALENNALVSFDVNLRHNLWPGGMVDRDVVNQCVAHAHVLKFSSEEFEYLSDGNFEQYLNDCLSKSCDLLIITDGGGEVRYFTQTDAYRKTPPAVTVADTTGGGDGFIGALLFALSQSNNVCATINDASLLSDIIDFACCCGGIAVGQKGAFPAFARLNQAMESFSQHKDGIPKHFFNLIQLPLRKVSEFL